jgi:hypothetical protein
MLARQACITAFFWTILATSCGGRIDRASGRCRDFSPCGGNIEGTWQVDDVCFTDDPVASANSWYASQFAACTDSIKTLSTTFSGTIDYSAGVETADFESVTVYTSLYTAECLSAIERSNITISTDVCSRLESGVIPFAKANGTCTPVRAACSCEMTSIETQGRRTTDYAVEGNTIVTDGSSDDFCVDGERLMVRSTNSAGETVVVARYHRILGAAAKPSVPATIIIRHLGHPTVVMIPDASG